MEDEHEITFHQENEVKPIVNESETKTNQKKKISKILILSVLLTCVGSSMLYGYNMAVLNLPAERIKCFLNKTIIRVPCKDSYNPLSEHYNASLVANVTQGNMDADFLYAQTSTIFVIAGVIGAFSTGWIADFIGRRNGLLFNHAFAIIGGIINGLTVYTEKPSLLFIGRFFIGLNSGIAVGLASMYLTEIAPRAYRGAIGACHQLAVTMGIVIGYITTMSHTLNTDTMWPTACGLTAIPAAISLCFLPFCPESPRFIFLKKHKEELARKEFIRINHMEDADFLIGELMEDLEISKNNPKFKFIQLFKQNDLKMPLIIACVIQVMQQLSGINAVISYSSSMLSTAGIPIVYSQYCVIAIGIFNVIFTLISLPLLERSGRRALLLWPSIVLAASLLFLTITVNLVNSDLLQSENTKKIIGGISVFLILTYIAGFALGLGPVPALIVSEIFRQETRGAAYSISQAIQWTSNLIVLFSYPNMNKSIGGYSFLPFLIIVIVCWVFFYLYMPETRNRTFDEIAYDLAFGKTIVSHSKSQTLKHMVYNKAKKDEEETDIS